MKGFIRLIKPFGGFMTLLLFFTVWILVISDPDHNREALMSEPKLKIFMSFYAISTELLPNRYRYHFHTLLFGGSIDNCLDNSEKNAKIRERGRGRRVKKGKRKRKWREK